MGTWLALTNSLDLRPLGTCLHGASVPVGFTVTPQPMADPDLHGRTQSCSNGEQGGSRVRSQAGLCAKPWSRPSRRRRSKSPQNCVPPSKLYPEEEDRQSQTENSSKNTRRATQMQQRDDLEAWISFLQCLVFIWKQAWEILKEFIKKYE